MSQYPFDEFPQAELPSTVTVNGVTLTASPELNPFRLKTASTTVTNDFTGSSLGTTWTAAQPGQVVVTGGKLQHTFTASGFFDNHVYYNSNQFVDSKVNISFTSSNGFNNLGPTGFGLILRRQGTSGSGACYCLAFTASGNTMTVNHVTAGGTLTQLATVSTSGYNFANPFTITFEATGVYPTTLVATCKFGDGSTKSFQVLDSTAVLQTSGFSGFASWVSGTNNVESATIETRKPLPSAIEKIAFVGDSNYTTSYPTTADCIPTQCANRLTNITGSPYSAVILGSAGAQTDTWVVGGALWNLQTPNIISNGVRKVVLMLGTNDAKQASGITTEAYMTNLNGVVTGLLALSGVKTVLIMAPLFHGGDSNASTFNGRSIERLEAIIDALAARYPTKGTTGAILADPGEAYYHTKRNYTGELADGIHVNATGGQNVGTIQADCIARALGL